MVRPVHGPFLLLGKDSQNCRSFSIAVVTLFFLFKEERDEMGMRICSLHTQTYHQHLLLLLDPSWLKRKKKKKNLKEKRE